ncbi:hypothetical protein U8V72_20105 [Priestia filamentosa]|uniref:hypothetical protein n=1 Tax=Priestia filamentosa TaxID=1402861 RepID=UPI000589010F
MTTMYEKKIKNGTPHKEMKLKNGKKIIELVTHRYNDNTFDSIHLLVVEVLAENKELGTMFVEGYDVSGSVKNKELNEIIKFCECR